MLCECLVLSYPLPAAKRIGSAAGSIWLSDFFAALKALWIL